MKTLIHTARKAQWSRAFKKHGAHIKDALKGRRFHITEADIANAVCRDHQNCAIARAIKRVTGADWVDVSASRVLIKTGKHTARRYIMPPIVQEQVRYFDTHEAKMAPCVVEIRPPPVHTKLGAPSHRHHNKDSHGTSKRARKPTR